MHLDTEDGRTGLYVVVSIYFCVLLACALWANYKNRHEGHPRHHHHHRHHHPLHHANRAAAAAAAAGPPPQLSVSVLNGNNSASTTTTSAGGGRGSSSMTNARNNIGTSSTESALSAILGMQSTDTLSSHYLGGRDLGPILTTGTIFASFFSGYTVVGIPNEAFATGWMALRWLAGGMSIQCGFFGTALRLRKAALVRNHKNPIDFITDRFQSQILRYTVLLLQIVPSMFYITAQVVALKSTFNSIFDLDPDETYPVLIIMTITLFMEWIGGLRCVAMTDCVQASIMVLASVCIPSIVAQHFGGWSDLDPLTYPRPDFYQTPTRKQQLDFWQYTMSLFSLFTLPHLMQRIYAAKDLVSLKCAFVSMASGMWFMMIGGVFLGTMAVQILQVDNADGETIINPYSELLQMVIDLGGFPKVAGLITITAALAAIMSTADSLLVAISQLITEEVVWPIAPAASPSTMVWVGRAASFCAISIASLMGISWNQGVSKIANINFQLSAQSVFIFMFGLYGTDRVDCHPWSLAIGALSSFIYVFCVYFGYISNRDDEISLNAGVSGVVIQLILIAVLEMMRRFIVPLANGPSSSCSQDLIFPDRPAWDIPRRSRFGERTLTPKLLWKMMEGVNEPLSNPWYASLMFLSISRCTPWVLGGIPTDLDEIGGTLAKNGLPWWVTQMIVAAAIPSLFMFWTLYRMPNRYPRIVGRRSQRRGGDNRNTRTAGPQPFQRPGTTAGPPPPPVAEDPDPDVMELTTEELLHRTAYDERNDLVYKRRRQILEKLGISPTEIDSIVASTQQQLQNFQPGSL